MAVAAAGRSDVHTAAGLAIDRGVDAKSDCCVHRRGSEIATGSHR